MTCWRVKNHGQSTEEPTNDRVKWRLNRNEDRIKSGVTIYSFTPRERNFPIWNSPFRVLSRGYVTPTVKTKIAKRESWTVLQEMLRQFNPLDTSSLMLTSCRCIPSWVILPCRTRRSQNRGNDGHDSSSAFRNILPSPLRSPCAVRLFARDRFLSFNRGWNV